MQLCTWASLDVIVQDILVFFLGMPIFKLELTFWVPLPVYLEQMVCRYCCLGFQVPSNFVYVEGTGTHLKN